MYFCQRDTYSTSPILDSTKHEWMLIAWTYYFLLRKYLNWFTFLYFNNDDAYLPIWSINGFVFLYRPKQGRQTPVQFQYTFKQHVSHLECFCKGYYIRVCHFCSPLCLLSLNLHIIWATQYNRNRHNEKYTHAHTHARTYARTHARTHTNSKQGLCSLICKAYKSFNLLFVS